MAREEHDREDLLGEATAYVERMEVRISASAATVFVGFRRDGSASFYFGSDPVLHFNAAQQLRRAFVDGLLYRAECGRLVRLRRERTATETHLFRSDLSDGESVAMLSALRQRLTELTSALDSDEAMLIGQAPAEAKVFERTRTWLESCAGSLTVAHRPHAG